MKVGMTIDPFQAEWFDDHILGGGHVVVTFFGREIYATHKIDYQPSEYILDEVVDVAVAEFGNMLAEQLDKRLKIDEVGDLIINE
jgi:hypothetical protein